eukprot:tig00000903_g5531.t1
MQSLSHERLRLQLELLWYDVRTLNACATSDEWATDKESSAGLELVARNISAEPVLSQKCTFRAAVDPRSFVHLVASEDLELRKCWVPTLKSFERLEALPRVNEDEEMFLDRAVMSSFVSRPIEYKMLTCVRADGGSDVVGGARSWVLLSQPLRNLVHGLPPSEETIPAKTTLVAVVATPVAAEGGAVHSDVTFLHQHEMYAGSNPFQLLLRAVHAKATRTALRTCASALKDLCSSLSPEALAALVPPCPATPLPSPSRARGAPGPRGGTSPKVDPAAYQDEIMFTTMASPEFRQLRSKHAAGEIPLGHFLEASLPVEEVSQHFGQMRLRQFADIKARAAAAAAAAVADLPDQSPAEFLADAAPGAPHEAPLPRRPRTPPPRRPGAPRLGRPPPPRGPLAPPSRPGPRPAPPRPAPAPARPAGPRGRLPRFGPAESAAAAVAAAATAVLPGLELPDGKPTTPFVQWVMPFPIPVVVNRQQLAALFPRTTPPPPASPPPPPLRPLPLRLLLGRRRPALPSGAAAAAASVPAAAPLPAVVAPVPPEQRRRFVHYETDEADFFLFDDDAPPPAFEHPEAPLFAMDV